MVSEAKKSAKKRYDEKTAYFVTIKLNKNTDQDIIQILESAENRQAVIKQALREMKRTGD